jgi:hypothetical protein
MLMMVKRLPFCRAIYKMNFPNSVNPKPIWHGNTEPSIRENLKACVESIQEMSAKTDKDGLRTLWKRKELTRNGLADILAYIVTDSYMGRDRHDLISGCTRYRYIPV